MSSKTRLLHERLAAIVSTLRHGEMVYIADAGSGTSSASLVPLAPEVEIIDVAVFNGCPTVTDLMKVMWEVGDFEAVFVTEDMKRANPTAREEVFALTGPDHIHELRYLPEFYDLRNRCKVFIQTGDYGVHSNVILVAGYPSPPIPVNWLTNAAWFEELRKAQTDKD